MPTPELQLVSRVIRGGKSEYCSVVEWGITRDDFLTMEATSIWVHIVGHFAATGSVPGINVALEEYSNFQFCDDSSMNTTSLCQAVRSRRLVMQAKAAAQRMVDNLDLEPMQAFTMMQTELTKVIELGVNRMTDVPLSRAYNEILQDIVLSELGQNTARAEWPWGSFQKATNGIQEDDYIVFYGRPKSMKTWVLCYLIASLFHQGKKVLIYTKEMTPKNIYKRIAACLAMVPYQDMRTGLLQPVDREVLYELKALIDAMNGADSLTCLSGRDVGYGLDTPAWFRSKAEKYKPDVGAIDGLYLMSSGGGPKQADHQRVMSLSREVRSMILDLRIPMAVTMQANRKAASHSNAELDEIAYSDAVGQDATIAIRVVNEKGKPTIALVVGGSREFQLHGVRIGGIPATDFQEKEIMTEKEINKATENDTGDSESDAASHAKERKPKKDKAEQKQRALLEAQIDAI